MYKKVNMLTSLDIKKLQSVFATKEDLDRFAIKEDLNWLQSRKICKIQKID